MENGTQKMSKAEYDQEVDEFVLEWPLVGSPSRKATLVGDYNHDSRRQSSIKQVDVDGNEVKTNWGSLHIANILAFFCAIEFSLFTTAIYPYMQTITCDDTSQTFYGFVVAAFSAMQGLSSPIYGYWANTSGSCKWPIVTGACFMLVGNVLYALAAIFSGDTGREWAVLVSRLVMGMGSGILGVVRSYVATASTAAERTKAVSINMAAFTTGIALGPALNILFALIGYPGVLFGSSDSLGLNMYTVTGWVGAGVMVIMIIIMLFFFVESYSGIVHEGAADPYKVLPKPKVLPICLCLYLWFAQQTAVSSVESLLSPFCIIMYDWDGAQALTNTGYMILLMSAVGLGIYMLYAFTPLGKADTRISCMVGLSLMALYYAVTYPWPFFTGHITVQNATLASNVTNVNGTCGAQATLAGCDTNVDAWCATTPQVPLYLFGLAFGLIFGAGFAPTTSSLGVMYSRVLGPRRQGTMQGVLLIVGSSARTFGPLIALSMFDNYGPGWTWVMFFSIVFLGVLIVIFFFPFLVPLVTIETMKTGQMIVHDKGVVYKM